MNSRDEGRKWITKETDEAGALALAAELSLPLPVSRILLSRGITDTESAGRFLNPRLSDLGDPFDIVGMSAAAERVWKALNAGSRITVFGDYDADGVTSTALLVMVLRRLGATPEFYVPSRQDDGYGLSVDAITKAIEGTTPDLIITVDCGTNSSDAVSFAKSRGVDVIVTDHHECESAAPADAVAVVNPKLGTVDDAKILAGVGVAFKLCHALVRQGNADGAPAVEGLDLRDYLDLVALGTVADVVPLLGENRTLVRHGLQRIKAGPRCGLAALIRVASVRTEIDCYHLGFLIGPRINAAGRLGSAEPALKLLLCEEVGIAKRLAGQLDAANRERKRIEEQIIAEVIEEIEASFSPETTFGLAVGSEGWHIGTIGIVAARLCGRYKRPAVVISFDADGLGRGSCRSVDSVNVVEALQTCSDLLESHGGHKMAAGLSIRRENMDAFRDRFSAACRDQVSSSDMVARYVVDGWITLGEADESLLSAVNSLRPLGLGNPTPIWGARSVRIVGRPRIVGKNHLKMTLACGGTQLDAIAFGMADRELYDDAIDILFHLQVNSYMGRESIQLNIKDFRPSIQN
jgi:single-stranded-DNA-specific exonuclease